jgi:hypothetical protein
MELEPTSMGLNRNISVHRVLCTTAVNHGDTTRPHKVSTLEKRTIPSGYGLLRDPPDVAKELRHPMMDAELDTEVGKSHACNRLSYKRNINTPSLGF